MKKYSYTVACPFFIIQNINDILMKKKMKEVSLWNENFALKNGIPFFFLKKGVGRGKYC